MITGIIAFVLFIIVCMRLIKKRVFTKIHLFAGIALVVISAVHILLTFELLVSRPVAVWITGAAALLFILAAFFTGIKKKRKMHRIFALCSLLLVIVHVALNITSVVTYQNQVKSIVVTDIDLSNIPDGSYVGECDVIFIYAKVQVTVKSGEISDIIIIEHRNERGETAERVVGDIVSGRRIDVDAVSGATNSSTVLKKAVENALRDIVK